MPRLSKFIDTSKCTACRACQTACKSWNQLPAEIMEFKGHLQTHKDTSPKTFVYVTMHERVSRGKLEWFFRKHQCMHCTDAACVKACPEGAISRTAEGAVVRDWNKCIGCAYCAQFCPFGIPKIEPREKKMYKCHLCSDRIGNNLQPACAKTCPTGAIQFGPREELVKAARARLAEVKKDYPKANLYGLDEQFLDGTNVFYLLLEDPEFYGLPAKPTVPAIVGLWKNFIQPLGVLLPLGAIGAIAVSAFMTRVVKVNNGQKHHEESKGGNVNG